MRRLPVVLPVDLPALAALFDETRKGPVRSFFDRQTGALETMPRDVEVEGVYDDILTAPDRWVEIQPLPARERRELRRRFAEQGLHDADVQVRLTIDDALAATPDSQALSRFAAVLRAHAELLDRWLAWRAAALAPLARAWLSALDIEPVDTKPAETAARKVN